MGLPSQILSVVDAHRDHQVPQDRWVTPVGSTASDTIGFLNMDPTFLRIANDGAATIHLLLKAVRACSQGSLHDFDVDIPGGESREYGPFDRYHYSDENSYVVFTLTGTYNLAEVGIVAVRQI